MKIYFFDGRLEDIHNIIDIDFVYLGNVITIDGADGPQCNRKELHRCKEHVYERDVIILTNSLVALSHDYGWNEEENHTDIYLWIDELHDFIRIDRLTAKEIRYAHNIEKMYLAGAFMYQE